MTATCCTQPFLGNCSSGCKAAGLPWQHAGMLRFVCVCHPGLEPGNARTEKGVQTLCRDTGCWTQRQNPALGGVS